MILFIYSICPFKKQLNEMIKMLRIPNEKFYRDLKFKGKFKVRVDDLHSFYLFHHGGTIENDTFWKGLFVGWEKDAGWIWIQLSAISGVIFDIGANTGIYSMVAKSVNRDALVYAFEPSNNTYSKLKKNVELNGYDIKCEQIALSNKNEEQIFYDVNDPNQTSASLSEEKIRNHPALFEDLKMVEYKVQTMTAISYIEANQIAPIDLIKMDIELHEPEAIEGFGKYLEEYKPIVMIEILTNEVAARLNVLIGDDFIKLHLRDINDVELVKQFKPISGLYNYLIFHKDISDKIRQKTSLTW